MSNDSVHLQTLVRARRTSRKSLAGLEKQGSWSVGLEFQEAKRGYAMLQSRQNPPYLSYSNWRQVTILKMQFQQSNRLKLAWLRADEYCFANWFSCLAERGLATTYLANRRIWSHNAYYRKPSRANQEAFDAAVQEIAAATQKMLEKLTVQQNTRNAILSRD